MGESWYILASAPSGPSMSHIELCRNGWFATLKVPVALRKTLGRTKFKQTLQTTDKRLARILAAPVVANWQAVIRQAAGQGDAVQVEAMRWREALAAERVGGNAARVDLLESLMADKAYQIEAGKGESAALEFASIARGDATPSHLHLDAWYASTGQLAAKTRDQMKKDVDRLVAQFPTLEGITAQAARRWVDELAKKGASPASIKRMLSFWRSFWRYLVSVEAVPAEVNPLGAVTIPAGVRKAKGGWVPLPPSDVVKLWCVFRRT